MPRIFWKKPRHDPCSITWLLQAFHYNVDERGCPVFLVFDGNGNMKQFESFRPVSSIKYLWNYFTLEDINLRSLKCKTYIQKIW